MSSHVTFLTRLDIQTRTKAAATIVMMHLLLAERRDGALPESLDGLPEDLNDPWTGKPFAWYPEGLPEQLVAPLLNAIEPHRPFLFSGGPGLGTIVRQEYEVFEGGAGGMGMSSMMEAGTVGPAEPEGFAQPVPPAADAEGLRGATEPEVKTVVTYTVQYEAADGEAPAVFMLPRPKK